MRLIVMNIPDQAEALAGWLERQLVGLDLAELVAELQAVHAPLATLTLDDVLGIRRLGVLNDGLSVLPASVLRDFLRHPRLLLDLQELVLEHGGPYWNQVDAGGEMELAMQRGEQRLLTEVRQLRPVTVRPVVRPAATARSWYQSPWVVSLATAAVILLAVSGYLFWKPPATKQAENQLAWGWSKPGALPQDVPAPKYLNTLADDAEDWFNKRPEDAASVARRINEYRQACSTLILSPNKPLKDEDRAWLVEKCQAWGKKLDEQLAALEAHPENAVAVRAEVDRITLNLQKALKERAAKAEST